jgi:hypothetical protein
MIDKYTLIQHYQLVDGMLASRKRPSVSRKKRKKERDLPFPQKKKRKRKRPCNILKFKPLIYTLNLVFKSRINSNFIFS